MDENHLNEDVSKRTFSYTFSDTSYDTLPQYINYIPSTSSNTSQNIPKDILEDIFRKVCYNVSGYNEPDSSECSSIVASLETPSPIPTPDYRLVNWQSWLQNRQKQVKNIIKKTNKGPCDVLMNKTENTREKWERKYILDFSKIHFQQDKIRGGDPIFWKIPPKLKSVNNLGDCFLTFSKSELNNIPLITYTETPRVILDEKNTACPEYTKSWLQSEYLRKKIEEYRQEIKLIEPHLPQREDIVIQGKKITLINPAEESYSENSFIFESYTELESIKDEIPLKKIKKCILMINKHEFNIEEKSSENISLYFQFHEILNVRKTIEIEFQNCGDITIEVEWYPNEITLTNQNIFKRKHHPVFFFNKNKFRLIPDEVMLLPIFFYCDIEGIYTEKWIIKTTPVFFNEYSNLYINLWANCYQEDTVQIWEAVEEKINHKAAAYVSSKILYSVVNTLGPEHQDNHIYKLHFLEEDLFTQNNPDLFFYHQNVCNLKKLYQKTTSEQGDCFDWNYDIGELRSRILNIYDEKLRKSLFETFKENLNCLMKPNYVIKSSGEHKYSLVRSTIMAMVDKISFDAEELKKNILTPNSTYDTTIIQKHINLKKRSLTNIYSLSKSIISENSMTPTDSLMVVKTEKINENKYNMYIESLYVKIYHHLSSTIEEVACLLNSLAIVSSNY